MSNRVRREHVPWCTRWQNRQSCLNLREVPGLHPPSLSLSSMRAEHDDQVTCRLVWELPAPVLAWVVTAEQDHDIVGLGVDGFWGFLSTEGSQNFWTSFNLQEEDREKEGQNRAAVAVPGTPSTLHLGFSGSLRVSPSTHSLTFLVGTAIH